MRNFVPAALSLAFLAVLIYVSDFRSIMHTLKNSNFEIILYGIGLWFAGALLRNVKWRYLLKKIHIKVPFLTSLKIYMISLYVSNLMPARVGDPARALLLRRYTGPTFSPAASSIIIERTTEMVLLTLLGLIGVLVLPKTQVTSFILMSAGIYLIVVFMLFFVIFSERRTLLLTQAMHRLLSFVPRIKRLERRLMTWARMISHSINIYKNPVTLFNLSVMTLLVWLTEILIVYFGFLAIDVNVPIWAVALITPITVLVGIITLLPGGLGSTELASVIIYSVMFSLDPAQILAASLISRFMSYWMYMITGPLLLATRMGRRYA